ncbi:ATP-binding protein [Streptomyces mirabilis]|uniref:ATP-binding protein n=1 Tax=Streptomyces TaxID=1883 RepID=UPI0029AE25E9|nr:ATP-binding protein [Streptomyces sp. AK02-04a]MDX3763020.1 roadblock/LC7 domain-containing protein [Streptomyces sp. AK02-04a]
MLRRNTAESLASLGRRSQGLVRPQLALITALEQQELDPEALAELFELDHPATRMRRNAESLLVLVDERSPQISGVTASSLELVQSAMGEVEQSRRVALAEIEPRRISGRAVAELSHLLAELVENALSFSPPDQPVDVHGWGDGDDYCVAAVDHGVGMSPEGLARANARISGEEAFLVAPTRYLGHYVVGRLARRLGVEVLLSGHPRRGRIRSRHPPRSDPRPRRGPAAGPADARLLHAQRLPGGRRARRSQAGTARDLRAPEPGLAHLRLRPHRRRRHPRGRRLLRRPPHRGLSRDLADHLSALVSGIVSLTQNAADTYGFRGMKLVVIEMLDGFMMVNHMRDGSCLGVLAGEGCDIGLVGYEMAVLADRAGALLTPQLIGQPHPSPFVR